MNKTSVGILTVFREIDLKHAITICVKNQIQMLLNNGFNVKLFVTEGCTKIVDDKNIFGDERVEWIYLKRIFVYDNENFKDFITNSLEYESVLNTFRNKLNDIEICFIHDVLSYKYNLLYNNALRHVKREYVNLKFLVWNHQILGYEKVSNKELDNLLNTKIDDAIYVALTNEQKRVIDNKYKISDNSSIIIPNCINIVNSENMQLLDLLNRIDIFTAEYLMIYPARLDRNKKFEYFIDFMCAIRENSDKTMLTIFCDRPALNDDLEDEVKYKNELKKLFKENNLENNYVFTSDLGFNDGVLHSTVIDLFSLSNLFVFPSCYESFGLITFEAACRGNYIILNQNNRTFVEISEALSANTIEFDFSKERNMEKFKEIFMSIEKNPIFIAKTRARCDYALNNVFNKHYKDILIKKEIDYE